MDTGKNKVYRYFADQKDQRTVYQDQPEQHYDKFFLLPAATKHIEKARESIAGLEEENRNLKQKGACFDRRTIFVEGQPDKIIFERALKLFYPGFVDKIKIEGPENRESGGGADFVANRLISWDHEQKTRPETSRYKAYGFFDQDEAGQKAKTRYSDSVGSSGITFASAYKGQWPDECHFKKLHQKSHPVTLPWILENIYSPALWALAKKRRWLEEVKCSKTYLSDEAINYLVNRSETINDLYKDETLRIYITHRFSQEGKSKAAKYIHTCSDKDARNYLYMFAPIVQKALKTLGIKAV